MNKFRLIYYITAWGIFCVAGLFASFTGARGIYVAQRETAPTKYTIDELVSKHAGQRWVTLVGKLQFSNQHMRHGKPTSIAPHAAYYLWVPMVDTGWEASDPVRVFVGFGPFLTKQSIHAFEEPLRIQSQNVVTGVFAPFGGPRNPQELFPRLRVIEPLFFLNAGNKPEGMVASIFFFLVGVCMFLAGGRSIILNWRADFSTAK